MESVERTEPIPGPQSEAVGVPVSGPSLALFAQVFAVLGDAVLVADPFAPRPGCGVAVLTDQSVVHCFEVRWPPC